MAVCGANNETWRLMWGSTSLILRRRPFSADSIDQLEGNILGLSLVDEAAVIQLATSTSVPTASCSVATAVGMGWERVLQCPSSDFALGYRLYI